MYYIGDNAGVGALCFGVASGTAGTSAGTASTTNERMRIDTSGNVLVTSAAGLGYGTGAGGTVTQATNKATAVTLNKPTGQITTSNAALAANTTVGFNVNNSLVTTSDTVLITLAGPSVANVNAYNIWCAAYSGIFAIFVRNVTGGSLSEAIAINFTVIKGATS
jgi:hypothetical protein